MRIFCYSTAIAQGGKENDDAIVSKEKSERKLGLRKLSDIFATVPMHKMMETA